MFHYGLQPASSGLDQLGKFTSPHHSPSDILYSSSQHIWPYQMLSKITNIHYTGLVYLQNGFINHNLHVFCWTSLQYHKQLLQHIRLDTFITPPRWCHHDITQLSSRFGSWWCIDSISNRTSPSINQKHTYKVNKTINCYLMMMRQNASKLHQTNPVQTTLTSIPDEHID